MDYEKAYKEALKRAKSFRTPDNKDVAAYIFPELKESGDERIRKALIGGLKNCVYSEWHNGVSIKECIALLEKQGEQKPADTNNKFIRMRETKPKDIAEFLNRLTTVEQEFLWEHIAKIRELDKEEQKHIDKIEPKFKKD